MVSRQTIYRLLLILAGLFILLSVIIALVTPRILNSDTTRIQIQELITDQTGGHLDYDQIKINLFPRPALQINQLEFDLPDIITIQADRLRVSTGLAKLIFGGNVINSLMIDKPEVRLDLPYILEPSTDPVTEDELWAILAQIIEPLITFTPDLSIELNDGVFELVEEQGSPFAVHGIQAELIFDAESEVLKIELNGQLANTTLRIFDTSMQFNINKLSVSTRLQPDLIKLKINNLFLKRPELEFDGNFIVAQTTPKFNLRLGTHVPDLIEVIPFVRPLMAKITDSTQVFDSIISGSLTDISMQSEANTIMGLFDREVMRLDARLDDGEFFLSRLSHHVGNVSGRLRVADRRVELTDAHLESGRSSATIEKAAIFRKNKSAAFMLEIYNNRIHFDLSALHKNLSRIIALDSYLKEVSAVSGQLDFKLLDLHGPLAEMADWKFNSTGSITDAVISTRHFPAPFNIHSGSFTAEDSSISFKAMHLQGLDADLKFSGAVNGKIPVPTHIEASATGEISEKFTRWVRETVGLPDAYALDTPITIKQADLTWNTGNNITAKGAVKVAKGPAITGDVAYKTPENIQVTLALTDDLSDARISFSHRDNRVNAGFSGHLSQETINHIFVEEQLTKGNIEGDFNFELGRDNGISIMASGSLQGENLLLPIGISEPLELTDFAITGLNQTMAIDHLGLALGDEHVDIDGSIASADGNYHLDLNLRTGPLDLLELKEQIEDIREELAEGKADAEQDIAADNEEQRQPFPLRGRISLDAEALSLKHLSVSPLRARIQFEPKRIDAQIEEAKLCGVDLLGSALITPDKIELKLPINAMDQDLRKSSFCLTGEKSIITGRYDLIGSFSADETFNAVVENPDKLIQAANGKIVLNARDGAIEQSPLVSRLLSVINLTEFYRGDFLTLDKSKLGYSEIEVEGKLTQGRLNIPLLLFNGTTLEVIGEGHIDLMPPELEIELLVAPLKTVDTIVKWLPGINYLLAGNLITIPVRLSGPAANTDIRVIPISSVGKGVLGIAERILKIPVKIIEPLTGDDEDTEPEAP